MQVQEAIRFGKNKMNERNFLILPEKARLLQSPEEIPGKYTQGDVALLDHGVQFHEHNFMAAGYEIYGRLHTYGR